MGYSPFVATILMKFVYVVANIDATVLLRRYVLDSF